MTLLVSFIVAALVLQPSMAGAQEGRPIAPGDRVRVSTMSGIRLTGRVISLDDKGINLMPDKTMVPAAVSRDTIKRLEVSLGRGRMKNVLKGALIGAAVGVALGFAIGDSPGAPSIGFNLWRAEDKAAGLGVLVGALGALEGSSHPSERWATATHDPPYAGHTSTGHAASLRLNVRF